MTMNGDIEKTSLLDLDKGQLTEYMRELGQPTYRADQVWHWLYKRYAQSFAEMTNLPQQLRSQLESRALATPLTPLQSIASADQLTHKALFRLPDLPAACLRRQGAPAQAGGATVEAVLMLYENRRTLCISSQVGCGMGCPFCATGLGGLARNMTAGEIVAQVLYFAHRLSESGAGEHKLPIPCPARVTNIVMMGMGEPLANYGPVWAALRRLSDPDAFGLGARRITLSTVGLVPMIRRMAEEPFQIGLAVSLHAPNDELRNRLAPINKRYPLAELLAACDEYVAKTRRRITFEYALMRGINDSPDLAQQLGALCQGLLCHINLIPLNPVAGSLYQPTSDEDTAHFAEILRSYGISTTVRLRRGIEINAGCGQLRQEVQIQGAAGVSVAVD